ncbi:MAG TPA: ankyrin repeat domain-containing protein [Chthonomonadaceae bacterium]|nr:ankyrin repeat domain-containing protein [Chthonomonadaceae bacterium]
MRIPCSLRYGPQSRGCEGAHVTLSPSCSDLAYPCASLLVRLPSERSKEHLWEAVTMQDLPTVSALLAKGTSADERDPERATPLMYVVGTGDMELFNLLLAHGADPNAKDPHGKTVLMACAGSYRTSEAETMAKTLLKHIREVDMRDENGATALMYASDKPGMIQILLDHGADIQAHDNRGKTVLMDASDWEFYPEASGRGHYGNAVSFLLKHGADVNARDQKGETALLIATSNRQDMRTVTALLAAGAKPNIPATRGTTPLMWAALREDQEQIRALRKAGATVGLMEALLLKDNAALNVALAKGADVNLRGPYGRTPLMVAAQKEDIALVERLLALGAKLDVRDDFELTALHIAVGADGWGWTERHFGGRHPGGPPEETEVKDRPTLLQLLITHGAQVDALDKEKAMPLQWAAHWGFTQDVKVLLESGAANQEARGAVPLADAQKHGHDAIVRLLIEHGVSVDTRDEDGTPLLITAARGGNAAQVVYLLAHHAEVNCRDASGATPLIHAAGKGNLAIVRTLLAAHADPHLKDYDDQTALDYANQKHHPDISALLQQGVP